jgi:hypothetical protein
MFYYYIITTNYFKCHYFKIGITSNYYHYYHYYVLLSGATWRCESESDEAGAHTLWTWDGAEPNAGPGPAREPKPRVHQRDTGAGC